MRTIGFGEGITSLNSPAKPTSKLSMGISGRTFSVPNLPGNWGIICWHKDLEPQGQPFINGWKWWFPTIFYIKIWFIIPLKQPFINCWPWGFRDGWSPPLDKAGEFPLEPFGAPFGIPILTTRWKIIHGDRFRPQDLELWHTPSKCPKLAYKWAVITYLRYLWA